MSRSRRKTPIFGHTSARSEAEDKRQWHKRWRASEREQLATVGVDTDHVAVHRNAVSSTWVMTKDGKEWFGPWDHSNFGASGQIPSHWTKQRAVF